MADTVADKMLTKVFFFPCSNPTRENNLPRNIRAEEHFSNSLFSIIL